MAETLAYDCFTDSDGRRFIAGTEVPEHVWQRVMDYEVRIDFTSDARIHLDVGHNDWLSDEGNRAEVIKFLRWWANHLEQLQSESAGDT